MSTRRRGAPRGAFEDAAARHPAAPAAVAEPERPSRAERPQEREEAVVPLTVRVPRSVRHRVRQAALDTDEDMQAIVLRAILRELDRVEVRH